jgi:hypothetical protein
MGGKIAGKKKSARQGGRKEADGSQKGVEYEFRNIRAVLLPNYSRKKTFFF